MSAAKKTSRSGAKASAKASTRNTARKTSPKAAPKKTNSKKTAAKRTTAKKTTKAAKKTAARKATPKKTTAKKTTAKKTTAKKAAGRATKKTPVRAGKKTVAKAPAPKKSTKKTPAKTTKKTTRARPAATGASKPPVTPKPAAKKAASTPSKPTTGKGPAATRTRAPRPVKLDAAARTAIRKELESELSDLEARQDELEKESERQTDLREAGVNDDFADAGTATFDRERDFSIRNNIRDLIDQITRALRRLEEGTYWIVRAVWEADRLSPAQGVASCAPLHGLQAPRGASAYRRGSPRRDARADRRGSPRRDARADGPTPAGTTQPIEDKAPRRKSPYVVLLSVAAIVVALDQLTKEIALRSLIDGPVDVIEGVLRWRLAFNPGGAFGVFQEHSEVFLVATLVVVALILFWARKLDDPRLVIPLGLIVGGGLGNVADRLFRSHRREGRRLHRSPRVAGVQHRGHGRCDRRHDRPDPQLPHAGAVTCGAGRTMSRKSETGERLDVLIAREASVTRAFAQWLIKKGHLASSGRDV